MEERELVKNVPFSGFEKRGKEKSRLICRKHRWLAPKEIRLGQLISSEFSDTFSVTECENMGSRLMVVILADSRRT
jgi:hypothetical protein